MGGESYLKFFLCMRPLLFQQFIMKNIKLTKVNRIKHFISGIRLSFSNNEGSFMDKYVFSKIMFLLRKTLCLQKYPFIFSFFFFLNIYKIFKNNNQFTFLVSPSTFLLVSNKIKYIPQIIRILLISQISMTQKSVIILPSNYKYQKDTRTQSQIFLSNQVVKGLTELNLNRFRNQQQLTPTYSYRNKYFFICLTGQPAFEKEFQNLDLPGEKIIFTPREFQINTSLTHEQYEKLYREFNLQRSADQLYGIVSKMNSTHKVVFVFHSFGTYITSTYMQKYGSSKISGYIDIGGVPITMFQPVKKTIQNSLNIDHDTIFQNAQFIYSQYRKALNSEALPLANQYLVVNFMKFVTMDIFHNMFQWNRNCGDNLKLIIFGRKDHLFSENLLSEKAIHFCYKKKLNPDYQKSLKQQYKKMYGVDTKNIQERFILCFEDGKHSVHMQQKYVKDIIIGIKQYIKLIDSIENV